MQLAGERCHVYRERISQRLVQHGEAPRGQISIALPISLPGAACVQGRDVDEHSLLLLRDGQEFICHLPKGVDLLGLTFQCDVFEQALECSSLAKEIAAMLAQPVIKVPAQRLARSRHRLMAMFSQAMCDMELPVTQQWERELEFAMLNELLQLLADLSCDYQRRPSNSTHTFIVEKSYRMTVNDTVNPPNITDLCNRMLVSRRTVQNSFKQVAETTPLNYLRSVRLNGVRRSLMDTSVARLSVGDAAAKWGFFCLSRFAADYQKLFGELPSQTRRKPVAHSSYASVLKTARRLPSV